MAEEHGHPPPPFMQEKVEVPGRLRMFWVAWHDLFTCRGESGAVPWTAVDAYARRFNYTQDEFDILVQVCRALDGEMNSFLEKERERKQNA